jgi:hypothetical protein
LAEVSVAFSDSGDGDVAGGDALGGACALVVGKEEKLVAPDRAAEFVGKARGVVPVSSYLFKGEPVFPERPLPANGEAGSKSVCSVVLRNAIDVCLAAIVVARPDSCPPSLADVVTVEGRKYSQRILRELIVSLERIIVCKETTANA